MKLVMESGLWWTGAEVASVPLAAVVEADGAVLAWTIDQPSDASGAQITFTDVMRADWLWRLFGEAGHRTISSAITAAPSDRPAEIDLPGIAVDQGPLDGLRRLAVGHWLRRWWPASIGDGIAGLDPALLDAEIALATVAVEDFLGEDTLDSDIGALLAPHAAALAAHARRGDPRVVELVTRCVELAEDCGVSAPGWAELADALDAPIAAPARQDDYALAAGPSAGSEPAGVIAHGATSMAWSAVPAGVFDAAEETVAWTVGADDSRTLAVVRTAVVGPGLPAGVPVVLRCGTLRGSGSLDDGGRARLEILDSTAKPVTASAAWDQDWSATIVTVGAEVDESAQSRHRARRFARRRLAEPAADAYLAEILAAEADY
ncbi:hypothetical protein BayCH28_11175 [Mycolicibacterium sp. CH28]|uniref:hypothetical protein n=1 Tax=Mycolicibacterium sp. CH28 TaxID=2512237 RepID=UPI0010809C3A|nr:hypothetical protein [Mycolicibacterium sp. CH28]TGD88310.1 hypothetical protein BayCH28_11175 [Mycolicibacterium sp. CH28]